MNSVCLTFFHRKLGPIIHYTCPGDYLSELETRGITELMDRVYMRDNIVKSSLGRDKTALNYLFELPSKWANQSKELLMLSIIFADRVISDFQEDQVRTKLINFVHNLKENKEIFKGLYFHDRLHFQIPLRRQILATNTTLQKLVDNFQRSLDIELDVALFKEP